MNALTAVVQDLGLGEERISERRRIQIINGT